MTTSAIDLHAHIISPDALRELALVSSEHAPRLVKDGGEWSLKFPDRGPMPVSRGMLDMDTRLAAMEQHGIHKQIVSLPPPMLLYQVPGEVSSEFARIQNRFLIEATEAEPRIDAFGTLPMQDVRSALSEIQRLTTTRSIRGVQIGASVAGIQLDDMRFEPVWGSLEESGIPVWVHPDQTHMNSVSGLSKYYLSNLIGNPFESTVAIASLLFGGVFSRHPKLGFGFVHGGGAMPYLLGRWEQGWRCRDEIRDSLGTDTPRDVMRRLVFDSLTHDQNALRLLGDAVGWSNVVLGSDFPFDMGSSSPVGAVEALGLHPREASAVLELNARRFLRPLKRQASAETESAAHHSSREGS